MQAEDLNICLKISKNLTLSDAAEETNQTEQTPSHSIDRSDEKNLNKGISYIFSTFLFLLFFSYSKTLCQCQLLAVYLNNSYL